MTELLDVAGRLLDDAGYSTFFVEGTPVPTLVFENDSCLGFVLSFGSSSQLIEGWRDASDSVISQFKF